MRTCHPTVLIGVSIVKPSTTVLLRLGLFCSQQDSSDRRQAIGLTSGSSLRRRAVGILLAAALLVSCLAADAQEPQVHSDLAYAEDHPAQRLDVYLAKSEQPTPAMIFIHGGGWRAGSKKNVPRWLKRFVAEGELSVISVEYRFTNVKTHPAQVEDCLRAIQFVRAHAKEWNIDPERIGVTGGSAGGHLTAWVTLHDDAAQPDSDDPVARQSTRLACGVSFAGPTDWSLLKTVDHKHPAYRQLVGHEPGTPYAEMSAKRMKTVSPITYVSKDDPPLMQVHGDKDAIVPIEHAQRLHEKLKSVGATSELVVVPGGRHNVAGANDQVSKDAAVFVRKHLFK